MIIFGEGEQVILEYRHAAGREPARAAIGLLPGRLACGRALLASHSRPGRRIGGAKVMHDQLVRLTEMAEWPNIR